ncbi:hypothetical protein C7S15_6870 [Burkholderia cepacia]|nr:hypothetical protein [Burkholderia cepacia]
MAPGSGRDVGRGVVSSRAPAFIFRNPDVFQNAFHPCRMRDSMPGQSKFA